MTEALREALADIRAIARDRRSGAAELADRAATALLRFVRMRPARPEHLAALAAALLRAQPSMAPLLNLAGLVQRAVEQKPSSPQQLQRALIAKLRTFRQQLDRANRQIARQFAARLRPGAVVLTYSYSSTVLAALVAASRMPGRRAIGIMRVICSEGRPQLEGRRLAARLARAGIPVFLVADASLPTHLEEADVVVVGADAILPSPAGRRGAGAYVNKIGTRVLQEQSRRAGKPFYVLADTSKILPDELWAFYRLKKGLFERIPLRRGVVVLTERGPLARADREPKA